MKAKTIPYIGIGIICFSLVFELSSIAQYRYEESYYKLSREVVTPHIKWANPYYKGPIKVLVIAPGFNQRETIELAQRLELDFDYVNITGFLYDEGRLRDLWLDRQGRYMNVYGTYKEELFADIGTKLKNNYDVIIVANVPWDFFPMELESKLWEKVYDGAGLLTTYYNQGQSYTLRNVVRAWEKNTKGMEFVTTGIPFLALPVFDSYPSNEAAAQEFVNLKSLGSGRVVLLNYPGKRGNLQGFTPNTSDNVECTFLDYEYYQSLVAKAVIWAAKKEAQVLFDSITPSGNLEVSSLMSVPLNLNVSSSIDLNGTIKLVVRDKENVVEFRNEQNVWVPAGKSNYQFIIPFLRAGTHFADFWILDGNKTINWATSAFTLISEPMIKNITLDKDGFDTGDFVKGKLELAEPVTQGITAEILLRDSYGRVITSQQILIQSGSSSIQFNLQLVQPVSRWIDVVAQLVKDGKVVHQIIKGAPVRINPKERDVLFLMWSSADFQYITRQVNKILLDNGVDTKSNTSPHAVGYEELSRDNLMGIPYMTRFAPENRTPSLIREPCLNDPEYRQKLKEKLEQQTRELKKYGPVIYTLGDENYLGSNNQDFCFSKYCIQDFQKWLQKRYESLEFLNKEWNTHFTNWTEVMPDTLDRSRPDGNFSRWIDHRMHMDEVFMDIHEFSEQAIMNIDPEAIVGPDGESGGTAFSGKNYWLYPRVGKYLNIYPQGIEALEQARSFALPGTRLGSWYGGYVPVPYGFHPQYKNRSEESVKYLTWWQVLMMHDTPAWFIDYQLSGFEGGIAPDFRLFDCLKWTVEEIKELKHGIGKVVLNSKRLQDGIAIHFSRASQLAAHALPEYGNHDFIERATVKIIEDLGFQFDWISYEQVEKGILKEGTYKVLFLPASMALSEKEVSEIRKFAEKGGTVIADIRPGIMDEHGKLFPGTQLNDVLGVEITKSLDPPMKINGFSVTGTVDQISKTYTLSTINQVHPFVTLSTAQEMGTVGKTPVVTINKFGKGTGIYLNFNFAEYWRDRFFGDWSGFRELMKDLLKSNGVTAPVTITTENRQDNFVEVVRFQDGSIQYVTLLSDEQPVPEIILESMVKLPHIAHVYNVREGKYLGYLNEIKTQIRPAHAQVYALVPYKVQEVSVAMQQSYQQGEKVTFQVALKTEGGLPGRHCVRIDVADPNGKICQYYGNNLFIYNGTGSGEIQLALNDIPGVWMLRVKDVTSGVEKEMGFKVREKWQ